MSPLTAIVLGAGPGIGRAVANKLLAQGYRVAVGSRNPDIEAAKKDGLHAFKIDVSKADTVLPILNSVKDALGGPANVVIYNAADAEGDVPKDPENPLGPLDYDRFRSSLDVGLHSFFVTAKWAIEGFASLPATSPRVLIDTANPIPFLPAAWPPILTLGLGKVSQAYMIDWLRQRYDGKGYQFYYAGQVKSREELVYVTLNAEAHATAYSKLIERKEQGAWDVRFLEDGTFITNH